VTAKILVVDDNRDICQVIADALEPSGAQVFSVFNGADALGVLTRTTLDLAIVDLLFSGPVSSDAVIEMAKARKCPLITMSGTLASDRHGREFEHPHLVKPFRSQQLIDLVGATLARRGRPTMVL
jgi:two-component system, OmpR family, response regulator